MGTTTATTATLSLVDGAGKPRQGGRTPAPGRDAVEDERDDVRGLVFDLGGLPGRGVRRIVEAAGRVEDGSRDHRRLAGGEDAALDAVGDALAALGEQEGA